MKTLEWLSATAFWKKEMLFFRKLLDEYAGKFTADDDHKKVHHLQNIVTYYKDELIDSLAAKLRLHEKKLADMLETKDELNTVYIKEHIALMQELQSANDQVRDYKEELFCLIEKAM
ncbi:hypothetical protein [Ohtaekwangia koreensis]|nr:hypothetical protein [Ohtaekwangia koreensis]